MQSPAAPSMCRLQPCSAAPTLSRTKASPLWQHRTVATTASRLPSTPFCCRAAAARTVVPRNGSTVSACREQVSMTQQQVVRSRRRWRQHPHRAGLSPSNSCTSASCSACRQGRDWKSGSLPAQPAPLPPPPPPLPPPVPAELRVGRAVPPRRPAGPGRLRCDLWNQGESGRDDGIQAGVRHRRAVAATAAGRGSGMQLGETARRCPGSPAICCLAVAAAVAPGPERDWERPRPRNRCPPSAHDGLQAIEVLGGFYQRMMGCSSSLSATAHKWTVAAAASRAPPHAPRASALPICCCMPSDTPLQEPLPGSSSYRCPAASHGSGAAYGCRSVRRVEQRSGTGSNQY